MMAFLWTKGLIVIYLLLLCSGAVLVGFFVGKFFPNSRIWRRSIMAVCILISVAVFAWNWFVNPLPSDEVMIKHFNEHRAEYEELIAGYISAEQQGNEGMKVWLSSPRKFELQHAVKAKDERLSQEVIQWNGGIEVHTGLGDRKHIVYAMTFHFEGAAKNSIRENSVIWKSYDYFADVQPLTNCSADSSKQCLGRTRTSVLSSLNGYPLFPATGSEACGSFLRRLDNHWFLRNSKACL
jgi:hypothetical protein